MSSIINVGSLDVGTSTYGMVNRQSYDALSPPIERVEDVSNISLKWGFGQELELSKHTFEDLTALNAFPGEVVDQAQGSFSDINELVDQQFDNVFDMGNVERNPNLNEADLLSRDSQNQDSSAKINLNQPPTRKRRKKAPFSEAHEKFLAERRAERQNEKIYNPEAYLQRLASERAQKAEKKRRMAANPEEREAELTYHRDWQKEKRASLDSEALKVRRANDRERKAKSRNGGIVKKQAPNQGEVASQSVALLQPGQEAPRYSLGLEGNVDPGMILQNLLAINYALTMSIVAGNIAQCEPNLNFLAAPNDGQLNVETAPQLQELEGAVALDSYLSSESHVQNPSFNISALHALPANAAVNLGFEEHVFAIGDLEGNSALTEPYAFLYDHNREMIPEDQTL